MKKSVYVFRTKARQLNGLQALSCLADIKPNISFDMKKKEIIRRCYGGMKERHGVETIILFHVGDSFEAYFDDAETITRITEVPRFKMTAAGIPASGFPTRLGRM